MEKVRAARFELEAIDIEAPSTLRCCGSAAAPMRCATRIAAFRHAVASDTELLEGDDGRGGVAAAPANSRGPIAGAAR